jgi:hypothetical protein
MTDNNELVITYDHEDGLVHTYDPKTGITTHEFTKERVAEYWAAKKISFAIRYENCPIFKDKVDRGRYLQIYQKLKYEYDEEFKAKKIANAKKYNEENKEKQAEAHKKYKKNNADKINEQRRIHYHNVIKPRRLAEKERLAQQAQQV